MLQLPYTLPSVELHRGQMERSARLDRNSEGYCTRALGFRVQEHADFYRGKV